MDSSVLHPTFSKLYSLLAYLSSHPLLRSTTTLVLSHHTHSLLFTPPSLLSSSPLPFTTKARTGSLAHPYILNLHCPSPPSLNPLPSFKRLRPTNLPHPTLPTTHHCTYRSPIVSPNHLNQPSTPRSQPPSSPPRPYINHITPVMGLNILTVYFASSIRFLFS